MLVLYWANFHYISANVFHLRDVQFTCCLSLMYKQRWGWQRSGFLLWTFGKRNLKSWIVCLSAVFFYNFSPINDQFKRGLQPRQWLNGICIYLLWPGSVVTIVFWVFFGVQYHCRLHCDLNPKCFLQLTGPWLNYLDNSLCYSSNRVYK